MTRGTVSLSILQPPTQFPAPGAQLRGCPVQLQGSYGSQGGLMPSCLKSLLHPLRDGKDELLAQFSVVTNSFAPTSPKSNEMKHPDILISCLVSVTSIQHGLHKTHVNVTLSPSGHSLSPL